MYTLDLTEQIKEPCWKQAPSNQLVHEIKKIDWIGRKRERSCSAQSLLLDYS